MSAKSPLPGKVRPRSTPKAKPEEERKVDQPVQKEAVQDQKASEPTITMDQYMDEVRRRAHEIYLERGDKPGTSLGDWLQAEREIKARFNIRE